jgi:hypothetical protein
VIEFPTKSKSGVMLFGNDLGSGLLSNEKLSIDILLFQGGVSNFDCFLQQGSQAEGQSAKLVCQNFNGDFGVGDWVQFYFSVVNPVVSGDLVVPIEVYFQDVVSMQKLQYTVLEKGVIILD